MTTWNVCKGAPQYHCGLIELVVCGRLGNPHTNRDDGGTLVTQRSNTLQIQSAQGGSSAVHQSIGQSLALGPIPVSTAFSPLPQLAVPNHCSANWGMHQLTFKICMCMIACVRSLPWPSPSSPVCPSNKLSVTAPHHLLLNFPSPYHTSQSESSPRMLAFYVLHNKNDI